MVLIEGSFVCSNQWNQAEIAPNCFAEAILQTVFFFIPAVCYDSAHLVFFNV